MTTQTENKGKRFAIVAILLVVIAGLGTAAGLVMVNRSDDPVADSPQYVVMDVASTTPVFEPRDARGNDPFFPLEAQLLTYQEEVEEQIEAEVAEAQADAEPGETVVAPEFDVAALDEAVKTGLYGGTEENTCDPERLISFLFANPDIGEAWAKVQGIEFSEIPSYIRSLEVRVLAEPVNVLNHGYDFSSGGAYEIDTVLDAGTAVLVDENGDVRTRCYCGNPIRPKPPEHMPPRCLVFGAIVYTSPAGSTKSDGVPGDVLLTGRQTTIGGGTWLEIKWGTADNQIGWTQANNLRKHYCPTPTSDRFCPGPDATNVWETPDMTSHIGQVTGKVRTHDTTLDIFAPINPVGGIGNETIINDFMLIRFTQGAPSINNNGWVKLADLNQDNSQCNRIRQCVATEGPVWDRAGGGLLAPEDTRWVEFTGHFIGSPLVTFAEIRMQDGTGNYGWISNFYTPLPDSECEPPIYECIEAGLLLESATENPPTLKGQLANIEVTVLDGFENGRVEVQVDAPTGPTGWVDTSAFFDGNGRCAWPPECSNTTGTAWTEFPTNGVARAADATPTMIAWNGANVIDGGIGYMWINIGGTDYWIDDADLNSLPAEDCVPEVECTMVERGAVDEFTPSVRDRATLDEATESRGMQSEDDREVYRQVCCVDALFNSTNVADVAAESVPRWVIAVGSSDVAGVTWFDTPTPRYFRQADIVSADQCERPECPEPTPIPGRDDIYDSIKGIEGGIELTTGRILNTDDVNNPGEPEFGGSPADPAFGECCVNQLFAAQGVGALLLVQPVLVEIASGPHGAAPSWYQTTDGTWFPQTAIVDASYCDIDVDCPTDLDPTDPGPGRRDDADIYDQLDDNSSDQALAYVAAGRLSGIPDTWCCVDGDVYDGPDGAVKGSLGEPTLVILVDSTDDGTWHEILIDAAPGDGWVSTDQFLPMEDCRGGDSDCPRESILDTINLAAVSIDVCCAELPSGEITAVALAGESRETEAGTEYRTMDDEWILIIAFHPAELCQPDASCPEFSLMDVDALAAGDMEICCAAIGNGFEAVGLTGEAMVDDEGNVTHLKRNTGEWIPIEDFVGAGRCLSDPECPSVSVISPNDPLTCCVSIGGGDFEEVTLNGEQRQGEDGIEYQANNGEWYLFPADFADAGRCTPNEAPCNGTVLNNQCCERPNEVFNGQCVPPCATGQVRNANGACVTPEVTCPTGQVLTTAGDCVVPPCEDSDDDGICDVDDNCDFNPNPGQEDADQDGSGNPCDPCTDADGDLFCEIPGDINNDNCWGQYNPDQTDRDGDDVGDICDNCPATANSDQANADGVGTGDACELVCPRAITGAPGGDRDGDGVCDSEDNCVDVPNANQSDRDDLDGWGDVCDNCPDTFQQTQADTYGDARGDACEPQPCPGGDADNDGVCDYDPGSNAIPDNCSQTPNPGQQDTDQDGFGDACDTCPLVYNSSQQYPYAGNSCEPNSLSQGN